MREPRTIDFDLHGHVGVRLLDATPSDVAKVVRQLGPLQASLTRPPDISVRFVDEIRGHGPLTFVGLGETGFDDEAFYLLRGKGNVPARTMIPFDAVGGRCEVVCERGVPAVPLLLAIVNMTALGKGLLPLHASAFVHGGTGVLATGWAKGGKTEALLALAGRGAHYVGDEWVYVTPDRSMYGVPEPIRLWGWQLAQLPEVRNRVARHRLVRLGVLDAAARAVEQATRSTPLRLSSLLRRLAPVLRRQVYLQIPPARLFGADAIALRGRLDEVVLVTSRDGPGIAIEPIDAAELGRRVLASLEEERSPFMAHYRQFRFAFPDRRSPAVDQAVRTEEGLVERAFAGVRCSALHHPYPLQISGLVEPLESLLATHRADHEVPTAR